MKKILLLFITAFLSACGFRPMYTNTDADIYVAPINGINGIELRNALNAAFGGPHDQDAKYTITVKLNEPVTQFKAFEGTGDATWQEIVLSATYDITNDGKVIGSGNARASESYTFVTYLVASNASYNNAVQNTLTVLANKISAQAIAKTQAFENK